MFDNSGEKIKVLATIIFWLDIVAATVVLLNNISGIGVLIAIAIIIVAWASSLLIYGFGELIESTQENESASKKLLNEIKKANDNYNDNYKSNETNKTQPPSRNNDGDTVPESLFKSSEIKPIYYCGECGNPGPYEDRCPECGSSIKKYNH